MARVTVEDCVVKVPNRFELVLLAAQRAREITSGSKLTVDQDDDKNPVVALREIADETIALDHLRDSVVRGLQKHVEIDEPEESQEIELDPALFGLTAAGPVTIGEDEAEEDEDIEEQALDEELEEDMLAVEGEAANETEIEDVPGEEPAGELDEGL